jgi:hypothetical protein
MARSFSDPTLMSLALSKATVVKMKLLTERAIFTAM